MSRSFPSLLGACAGIAILAFAAPCRADAGNVLVLYDERRELPGLSALDASLARTLSSESDDPVALYREDMDLSRFGSADYRQHLRDHLRAKYANMKIDVVVAVMGPALDFMLHHGDSVAPEAPIVFAGIDSREFDGRALPAHVTGVLLERRFAPTLELALRLHPKTRRFVFVAGTSQFDRRLIEQAKEELRPFERRYDLRYLTELPMPELLAELGRLPRDTVVLCSTIFRDGAGTAFVPHLAAESVAAASNAPVYGFVDQFVGRGIVGGRLYTLAEHGAEAARLALSVLSGADPAEIAPRSPSSLVTMIDYRQLERWNVREEMLPPDAVVLYRPPTLWSQHRNEVAAAASILSVQALMIAALLLQRSSRRRAESKLRESENRLRTMADTAPVLIWMSGPDKRFVFLNRMWLDYTGLRMQEALGMTWLTHLHPDDVARCSEAFDRSLIDLDDFTIECRLRRHDGTYRWMLCTGLARSSLEGDYLGHVSCWTDVSERKETELQLQRHRAELAHINRIATMGELTASLAHELCQPLGAILSNAGAGEIILNKTSPALPETREILDDIQRDAQRAGETIHRIRSLMRKQSTVRRPVELESTFENLHRLVHAEAAARRAVVRSEAAEAAWVLADPVQLQQVLLNLLLNALDAVSARPDGERRVVMSVRDRDEDSVTIAVRDTGQGVPPDVLSKLFRPFYTTKQEGLGMGLSIARTIVEAHGGSIWAENNEDGGATFCVTLPAAERECSALGTVGGDSPHR